MTIRTFPLSQNASTKMQQIIDKGGYQYGDKVTVYYNPCYGTSDQVQRETLENRFDSRSGNMLRLPAVCRTFLSFQCGRADNSHSQICGDRCEQAADSGARVPLCRHAGYVLFRARGRERCSRGLSSHRKIIVLGVAALSSRRGRQRYFRAGAWRTPLGDAQVDEETCRSSEKKLAHYCAKIAWRIARSIRWKYSLPFLQVLVQEFTFVPVALGTVRFRIAGERGGSDRASIAGFERACVAADGLRI